MSKVTLFKLWIGNLKTGLTINGFIVITPEIKLIFLIKLKRNYDWVGKGKYN